MKTLYKKHCIDDKNKYIYIVEKGEWKKLIKLVCRKLMKGENIAAISDALEEDSETIRMIVHVVEKRPDDMMDHIDEYVEEVLKIVNGA